MLPDSLKLNTGAQIPAVGLGTWQSKPGEVRRAVAYAIKNGYRHIDAALTRNFDNLMFEHMLTSRVLGNENEVGQGIKDSGVPRSEIFLTSKLWNAHHTNVAEGLQTSLDALGVDYLDLYLVHWPVRLVPNETSPLLPTNPDGTRAVDRSWDQSETWRQMEEVYRSPSRKVRAIGVANWSIPYLKELQKKWTVVPAVNQVELHPFLPQHELRAFCKSRGILLEAYSPLGSTGAPIASDPQIQAIAHKNNVSPATVLISYHVNKGVVVLPKSVNESRISDNRQVISLEKEDLAVLDGLTAGGKTKRLNTPLWGWDLGFEDWYGPVEK